MEFILVLQDLSEEEELQEAIEGIKKGLDDVKNNRTKPFEEFKKEFWEI